MAFALWPSRLSPASLPPLRRLASILLWWYSPLQTDYLGPFSDLVPGAYRRSEFEHRGERFPGYMSNAGLLIAVIGRLGCSLSSDPMILQPVRFSISS